MGKNNVERRAFPLTEVRSSRNNDGGRTIEGYAAVFGEWSEDLGGFRERIRPGAFKRTLDMGADVRALFNHDPNFLLGRSRSGTLEMSEDDTGLRVSISPPDTEWANGVVESIDRGDIDQMSFGFQTVQDEWLEDETPSRELVEVKLFDVSPVTYPAYPQTSVGMRSLCEKAGVDTNRLSVVLVKADRGIDLSDGDRSILAAYIERLSAYLPTATDGDPFQVEHSPEGNDRSDEPESWVRFHRSRLDLVELTHGGSRGD
jgi:HK97 family phage prohead protease|tara:strand:+ start:47 stop:823 length:777 start_codon:yes stop_codon:yes gene_type:complete